MTLYHNGYVEVGKTLVLPCTIGVTNCGQVDWLLINTSIWPILRFMVWVPNIYTLANTIVVVGKTGWWTFITSSLNNCLNLSSTKGQQLNKCPTYWQ